MRISQLPHGIIGARREKVLHARARPHLRVLVVKRVAGTNLRGWWGAFELLAVGFAHSKILRVVNCDVRAKLVCMARAGDD